MKSDYMLNYTEWSQTLCCVLQSEFRLCAVLYSVNTLCWIILYIVESNSDLCYLQNRARLCAVLYTKWSRTIRSFIQGEVRLCAFYTE